MKACSQQCPNDTGYLIGFSPVGRAAQAAGTHSFRAIAAKTASPAGDDALAFTASRIEKTPVSKAGLCEGE
jgi:hypothetical protein